MNEPATVRTPPRFLYFDLGRVLIDFDHRIGFANLARLFQCPAESVETAFHQASWPLEYEKGRIPTREACRQIRDTLGGDASDESICLAISRIFQTRAEMLPLVCGLYRSGIRMGILSNTCEAHWNFLMESGYRVLDLFPVQALSFRMGRVKPEPEIFRQAAQLAGVRPGEIFFTDDIPAHVEAAAAAGFDAILFPGAPRLARELLDRKVPFAC